MQNVLAFLAWFSLKIKYSRFLSLILDRAVFHGHEPLDTDSTDTLEGEAWLMHNDFAQDEGWARVSW